MGEAEKCWFSYKEELVHSALNWEWKVLVPHPLPQYSIAVWLEANYLTSLWLSFMNSNSSLIISHVSWTTEDLIKCLCSVKRKQYVTFQLKVGLFSIYRNKENWKECVYNTEIIELVKQMIQKGQHPYTDTCIGACTHTHTHPYNPFSLKNIIVYCSLSNYCLPGIN